MRRPSGDPVPSVPEDQATGKIAELYDDIRRTLGVPVVNLIWRNLASISGGLGWAWSTAKPLYEKGVIHGQARALREGQLLPPVPVLSVEALRSAGVDADDEAAIRTILDTYDRSNPLNLVALSALLARLRSRPSVGAGGDVSETEPEVAVEGVLPPLLGLHEMSDDTALLVQALNRLGARGADHILVSMPRHLAHWPGFLMHYRTIIAPYDEDGRLAVSIDSVLTEGRERGERLAAHLADSPMPDQENREAIDAALEDFSCNAIARMIPVVSLLKQAMPCPD